MFSFLCLAASFIACSSHLSYSKSAFSFAAYSSTTAISLTLRYSSSSCTVSPFFSAAFFSFFYRFLSFKAFAFSFS